MTTRTKRYARRLGVLAITFPLLPPTVHAGPFKFLMMMNKDNENGMMARGVAQKTCIDPHALEQTQEELALQAQATQACSEELTLVQRDLESQRHDFDERVKQFEQERESNQRFASIQEDLNKRTAEIQSKLESEIAELRKLSAQKDEEMKVLAKETQAEHSDKIKEIEKRHNEILKEYQKNQRSAEHDKDLVVGEKRALQQLYDALETKYERVLQNMETETEKYIEEHFEEAVSKRSREQVKEWEDKVAELETKSKALLEEAAETSRRDIERAKSMAEDARNELRETLETVSSAHDKEMHSVRDELRNALRRAQALEKAAEDTTKELARLEEELQDSEKLVGDYKRVNENLQLSFQELKLKYEASDHEKEAAVGEFASLQKHLRDTEQAANDQRRATENLQASFEDLTKLYEKSVKDAEYWESAFQKRHYLNYTQVFEDSVSVVKTARKVTGESWQKHKKVAEETTETYFKKSKELYDAHFKGHVDKAIIQGRPLYDEHFAPVVSKIGKKMGEISAKARATCCEVFNTLVAQFRSKCPRKYSMCQRPEETVTVMLQVLLVLLAILLRRVIWRLLAAGLRLVLGILWFFSPLRLCLRLFSSGQSATKQHTRKQSTHNANGKKARVKVEQ